MHEQHYDTTVQYGSGAERREQQPAVHVHAGTAESARTSSTTRDQVERERDSNRKTAPVKKAAPATAAATSVGSREQPADLVPHYLIGQLLSDPTFDHATLYEAAAATAGYGNDQPSRQRRGRGSSSNGGGGGNDDYLTSLLNNPDLFSSSIEIQALEDLLGGGSPNRDSSSLLNAGNTQHPLQEDDPSALRTSEDGAGVGGGGVGFGGGGGGGGGASASATTWPSENPEEWSPADVSKWLKSAGYGPTSAMQSRFGYFNITGEELLVMGDDELHEMHVALPEDRKVVISLALFLRLLLCPSLFFTHLHTPSHSLIHSYSLFARPRDMHD
jgi:hypothetical protein